MLETKIVKRLSLLPGDRIITPKSYFRIIKHHALYLGENENGEHFICENKIGNGVVLTRVKDFFEENFEVTKIVRFTGSHFERMQVVRRALSKLGQPYKLFKYNCETFSNDVLFGKKYSTQINNALLGASLLFFIFLIFNTNESK